MIEDQALIQVTIVTNPMKAASIERRLLAPNKRGEKLSDLMPWSVVTINPNGD